MKDKDKLGICDWLFVIGYWVMDISYWVAGIRYQVAINFSRISLILWSMDCWG